MCVMGSRGTRSERCARIYHILLSLSPEGQFVIRLYVLSTQMLITCFVIASTRTRIGYISR